MRGLIPASWNIGFFKRVPGFGYAGMYTDVERYIRVLENSMERGWKMTWNLDSFGAYAP